jgi:non-ribosomal peptide synthetase component F
VRVIGAHDEALLRDAEGVQDGAQGCQAFREATRGQTVATLFRDTVRAMPTQVALRAKAGEGWVETTYAEYADGACRVAAALSALGVAPGDRVVLMMRNRPEFHLADVGVLLAGATPSSLPEDLIDEAIGDTLRLWLTPLERHLVAQASQSAAVAVTGTPVAWRPDDDAAPPAAGGMAMPVGDVYRSVHGRICRDVRQTVLRSERALEQQVTLCREDEGANLFVWLVPAGDR